MGLWIRSGGRHAQGLGTAGRWGHARGPCTGSRPVQPAEAAVRGVWLRNFRAAESDVSQGDAQDVGVRAGTSRSRGAWAGPGPTAALGGLSAARGPGPAWRVSPHTHRRGEAHVPSGARLARRAKRHRCIFRLVRSVLTIVCRWPSWVTGPHVPEPGGLVDTHL